MVFLSMDTSGSLNYIFSLGGSQDDIAVGIVATSDGYAYGLGYGSSVEFTNY